MPGANAVFKRALSRSKYPSKSAGSRRTTSATASLRIAGAGAHTAGGFMHANSTSEGRTRTNAVVGKGVL
jgi:hypothetical protein